MKIKLKDERDTRKLAILISHTVSADDQIGLIGTLGAGKTTFVRFLVEAVGISVPVSSPTFVLMNEYNGSGIRIEHWDLYRLSVIPEELSSPSDECIRLIEWADKFPEFCNSLNLLIKLSSDNNDGGTERVVSLSGDDRILKKLKLDAWH